MDKPYVVGWFTWSKCGVLELHMILDEKKLRYIQSTTCTNIEVARRWRTRQAAFQWYQKNKPPIWQRGLGQPESEIKILDLRALGYSEKYA